MGLFGDKNVAKRIDVRKKISEALKGKNKTEEHKKKLSLVKIGKKSPRKGVKLSEETKRKMSVAKLGKKHSLSRRITKKKTVLRADKHWNWKGGITSINVSLRNSLEYKLWRESVFLRDDYRCCWCKRKKEVSGKLNAHHIKPFAYFPELRFAIDNGITLCKECHKKTDNYLWKSRKNYDNINKPNA